MSHFLDAIRFIAILFAMFGLPGLLMLYGDWKHHKGWFR